MSHSAIPAQPIRPPRSPGSDVGAILLNWKDEAAVWRQVERLRSWGQPPDIWVVENEPLREENAGLDSIHRIQPGKNIGYAAGINAAWRQMSAQGGYAAVLLLNTDIDVEESVLAALRETLHHQKTIGVIGPLLREPDPDGMRSYAGGRDPVRWIHTHIPCPRTGSPTGPIVTVDYVPGTVCLIRSGLMEQLGGLEESFFFSGEVADFCLCAPKAGFRCAIHPGVSVTHHLEAAGPQRGTLYLYYSLRNRFLLARRHRPRTWPLWWLLWTLRGLAMALLRLARRDPPAARSALCALRDAWSGRFGPTSRR